MDYLGFMENELNRVLHDVTHINPGMHNDPRVEKDRKYADELNKRINTYKTRELKLKELMAKQREKPAGTMQGMTGTMTSGTTGQTFAVPEYHKPMEMPSQITRPGLAPPTQRQEAASQFQAMPETMSRFEDPLAWRQQEVVEETTARTRRDKEQAAQGKADVRGRIASFLDKGDYDSALSLAVEVGDKTAIDAIIKRKGQEKPYEEQAPPQEKREMFANEYYSQKRVPDPDNDEIDILENKTQEDLTAILLKYGPKMAKHFNIPYPDAGDVYQTVQQASFGKIPPQQGMPQAQPTGQPTAQPQAMRDQPTDQPQTYKDEKTGREYPLLKAYSMPLQKLQDIIKQAGEEGEVQFQMILQSIYNIRINRGE